MKLRVPLRSLAVLALLPACAMEPPSPGEPDVSFDADAEPDVTGTDVGAKDDHTPIPDPPPDQPARYLRVQLTRTDAGVAPPELTVVESPFELPKHRGGDHVVVTYAGDQVVAAQPFSFGSSVRREGIGADGRWGHLGTLVTRGRASVLVSFPAEQALDRIAVLDDGGAVVAEATIPVDLATMRQRKASRELDIPGAPNLVIYTPAMTGELMPEIQADIVEVVSVGELPQAHKDAIIAGFAAMPPNVRAAVNELVVAKLPDEGRDGTGQWVAWTDGGLVLLNADTLHRSDLIDTLVHEATHAYENLLTHPEGNGLHWEWPQPVRDLAVATLRANQLQIGFTELWERAHNDALEWEATLPYTGAAWSTVTDEAARGGGFVEAYGSSDKYEDIATYAEALARAGRGGSVLPLCEELRGAPANQVPRHLYIPYLKVMMLANAGFITRDAAERCYGSAAVHGPEGIVLHKADGSGITLNRNVVGGWISQDGGQFTGVLADGSNTYRMMIRIKSAGSNGERVPPFGLNRLDDIGYAEINGEVNNAVYLSHSNSLKARTSDSGLALVTSVNPSRYEIVVFNLKLRNAVGAITDRFPLATFVYEP